MTTTIGRIKGVSGPRPIQLSRPKKSKQVMVTYRDNGYNTFTMPLEEACSKQEIKRLTDQGDLRNV